MAKSTTRMIDGCKRNDRPLQEKLERANNLRIYGNTLSQSIGVTNVHSFPKKKVKGRR